MKRLAGMVLATDDEDDDASSGIGLGVRVSSVAVCGE